MSNQYKSLIDARNQWEKDIKMYKEHNKLFQKVSADGTLVENSIPYNAILMQVFELIHELINLQEETMIVIKRIWQNMLYRKLIL